MLVHTVHFTQWLLDFGQFEQFWQFKRDTHTHTTSVGWRHSLFLGWQAWIDGQQQEWPFDSNCEKKNTLLPMTQWNRGQLLAPFRANFPTFHSVATLTTLWPQWSLLTRHTVLKVNHCEKLLVTNNGPNCGGQLHVSLWTNRCNRVVDSIEWQLVQIMN